MKYREIMDIDTTDELRNRTWWWWWWIFFFRNQAYPERTKQMVILWGTRNCREILVNNHLWLRKRGLEKNEFGFSAHGMVASWYYNGSEMIDPLFIDDGLLRTEWYPGRRRLSLLGHGRYEFSGENDENMVAARKDDLKIEIKLKPWTSFLSDIVPSGRKYFMHLSYAMHKIRGVKAWGRISFAGNSEEVEGTAYFQKVRINSPTTPWYWGVFHSERGHYIDYFMPHIGPPMFRRTERHHSKLDWGEKMLSRSWRFYDAEEGVLHTIRKIRIRKHYQNDLPIFVLSGDEGDKMFEMEMRSYSRAYWRIQQPLMRVLNTVLYYNEYPANLTRFVFESKSSTRVLDDLKPIAGNCEHAWGII